MARYTPENTALRGNPTSVFCDGVKLEKVVEVDDILGFAVVMCTDEDGKVLLDGNEIKMRLVTGNISVAFPDAP